MGLGSLINNLSPQPVSREMGQLAELVLVLLMITVDVRLSLGADESVSNNVVGELLLLCELV